MDTLQERLLAAYVAWKTSIAISQQNACELSPPLLISVPDGYEAAKHRILFCGQETYGWSWDSDYRIEYPEYDKDFPYDDVRTFADFLNNDDAVEALCWGYREFNFSERQPLNRRGPFWRAFREVQGWPGASLVWSNISRCDFQSGSILSAPKEVIDEVAASQRHLLVEEMKILRPETCLFFIGPNYDGLLSAILPDVELSQVDDIPVRQLARLSHPSLPTKSFRTYHPGSLSRQKLWGFVEKLRHLAID